MATTNQGDRTFFELLPAEIRDQIYDATMEQDIEKKRLQFQFRAPCPHLRLISHRFKDEYDARSTYGTVLDVSFPLAYKERALHPKIPGLTAGCDSLRLNIILKRNRGQPDWYALALACYRLISQLDPRHLQGLEINLAWDSVHMLKEFASQCSSRSQFLEHLDHCFYNSIADSLYYGTREFVNGSGVIPDVKLRYGGISPLNKPMRLKCHALGAELLKKPITLGTWIAKGGYYELDEDRIRERLSMETVVEAATQASSRKDQSSADWEIDISEDQIWQGQVEIEVKDSIE
jgi:hypothetical protein